MNQDTLFRFFMGQTNKEEEEEIRDWMDRSNENLKIFLNERKIFDTLLFSEIDKSRPKEYASGSKHTLITARWISISVLILIIAGSAFLFQRNSTDATESAQNEIIVPSGQYVQIKLPDNTKVWLNARTTFRYPEKFTSNERRVFLDGEAYFDISKNKKHPFIVETKKYNIQATGTQFNVESYTHYGNFATTLMQGGVLITATDNPDNTVALTPGNKACEKNNTLVIEKITDYSPYMWKEGLISFKNQTFYEIMKDFEKHFGIKINIQNQQVQKHVYTGKFRLSDGVDYALRVLQKNIQFNYERKEEEGVINIK